MTIDERIEFLLKMSESHEANSSRLFELHAETEQALARFISRTDETLNIMARILEHHEHRLSGLEGGVQ
jgi:energy-converting hydrogenase A subunit M